jgi:hypothetical protein
MSKKRFFTFGTMIILMVLALASVGVGYGLWSETLLINGVVNTGTVDAALSIVEVDQSWNFNDGTIGNGVNDDNEAEGKDVAECVATMIDENTMQVTITNGYPLFNCFVRWGVTNEGTIPLHVYQPDYFIGSTFYGTWGIGTIETAELHINGWPYDCYTDPYQLHPGETEYCNLHVNIKQAAAQGATYSFQLKVFARQWNEVVAPPWR